MFLLPDLEEKEHGVFVRKVNKKAVTEDIQAHYKNNALEILKQDRYHYTCFQRRFADLCKKEFYSVADVAGGHPKLASCLNVCGEITVYDEAADMYKKLHKQFLKLYPVKCPVKYETKQITNSQFTPNAELAICCHILEHLKAAQAKKLLKNLETKKVIVYGPNIERAPNQSWIHYRPADHQTFATLEAMCAWVEAAGFSVRLAVPYQEDYLIYAERA